MKKSILISILTILFLNSCVTLPKYTTFHYANNFKYLTEKGIFVTTASSVGFDYNAIGLLTAISKRGINESKNKKEDLTDLEKQEMAFYGRGSLSNTNRTIKQANIEDAFKELYKGLQEMGANGIIDLKIEYSYVTLPNSKIPLDEIKITGLAIKK